MRIIDADALREAVESHVTSVSVCATAEQARGRTDFKKLCLKDIDEAPTVGGWISVEDKLPRSMTNKVLVWLEHEELVGYIGFGHYEKYKGQEIWFDLENNEAFSVRGYKVTHWMPLPEPPKEENNNEDAQS